MITSLSWRRALAVPAALTLALGGALLGATAASAAVPADLVIADPVPLLSEETGEVIVTIAGTVAEGATLTASKGDAVQPDAAAVTVTGTAFAVNLTYDPSTDDETQAVTFSGTLGAEEITPQTVTFQLPAVDEEPAPEPAPALALTSPVEGSTQTSRTFDVVGTAPAGSRIVISVNGGPAEGTGVPLEPTQTSFSFPVTLGAIAGEQISLLVTALAPDGTDSSVTRTFTLPAAGTEPTPDPEPTPQPEPLPTPVLATPVFTAPVEGEVVVGDRVTFQGTGTPGADIGVVALPTAQLDELERRLEEALGGQQPAPAAPAEGDVSVLAQPSPQPEPVDPSARIVVGDDGTWSVTIAALPADYTAVAFSALLDEAGAPVIDPATGLPVVSAPSEELTFSVVAAAVVPAAPTPVAVTPSGQLAFTGTEAAGGALGLAAALTLAGTALTLVARRRRALATVDADQH